MLVVHVGSTLLPINDNVAIRLHKARMLTAERLSPLDVVVLALLVRYLSLTTDIFASFVNREAPHPFRLIASESDRRGKLGWIGDLYLVEEAG